MVTPEYYEIKETLKWKKKKSESVKKSVKSFEFWKKTSYSFDPNISTYGQELNIKDYEIKRL